MGLSRTITFIDTDKGHVLIFRCGGSDLIDEAALIYLGKVLPARLAFIITTLATGDKQQRTAVLWNKLTRCTWKRHSIDTYMGQLAAAVEGLLADLSQISRKPYLLQTTTALESTGSNLLYTCWKMKLLKFRNTTESRLTYRGKL